MIKNISIKFLAAAVLCLLAGIGQIYAQAGTGGITGVVTDANGAVVPNATVKLVNVNTGLEKTATVSSEGIYTFTLLQPGQYKISAGAANFSEQSLDVEVQVGRTTDANFTLGVGDVAAEVTISAEGIQTTEVKPDAVVDETAIENLPINGRRFQDFVTLTPSAQVDPQRGQISLSGQRGINSNINVDGVDYNQPFFGGIRGGERSNLAFTIPQESIREFQVVSAGYNAEFGRSTGGIVNAITKSGSNNFRGSLFYLIRPEDLAQPNEFAEALEEQRLAPIGIDATLAPTQHQFGGSIGGPIVKDRLFFFGSYEQQRFRAPRVVIYRNLIGFTPTASQQEAFDFLRGFEVPFEQTNDAYAGLGRIDWNINDNNRFNIRANYSQNKALNAVATGETSVDPTTNRSLQTNGTERDKNFSVVGQLISNFGAYILNDLRFQYAREDRPRISNAETPLVATSIGEYGTRSFLPTTQFDTRYQIIDAVSVVSGNHNFKFGGEYSRILADQLFGFNQFGSYNFFSSTGTILNVLSGVPNLSNPTPSNRFFGRFDDRFATYRKQVGNLSAAYKVHELAFYGQDSWRVTPKFTLNYGLRVEQQFNPDPELGNNDLIEAVQNGSFPILGGEGFDPTQIPDSGWQWGPRLGFAYDPAGDGKMVFRGFAGMYYARTPLLVLAAPFNNFRDPAGDLSFQLPFGSLPSSFDQAAFDAANPQYTSIVGTGVRPDTVYRYFAVLGINLNNSSLDNLPTLSSEQLQQLATSLNGAITNPAQQFNPSISGLQPIGIEEDFKNPRSFQFGFGLEREIARNWTVGLDYSQVNTTHLQRNRDINVPAPILLDPSLDPAQRPYYGIVRGTGLPTSVAIRPRPVPTLGSIQIRESSARSLYRALTLRTRLNRKWGQFNAYYVLSRSLSDDDNERDAGGIGYDDNFNLIPEYGLSRLDRTHQFTANPIFFLPYDFEVSSAIRLRSGLPVDAIANNDLNGDGLRNDRPYLVPGVPFKRNAFRNRNVYDVDLRVQKGFSFDERKRLVLSAEFFNVFNLSNIQYSGSGTTTYCSTSSSVARRCGLDGITNPNFRQIRDADGDIITFANFAGSQVFQMQFGARFQF